MLALSLVFVYSLRDKTLQKLSTGQIAFCVGAKDAGIKFFMGKRPKKELENGERPIRQISIGFNKIYSVLYKRRPC